MLELIRIRVANWLGNRALWMAATRRLADDERCSPDAPGQQRPTSREHHIVAPEIGQVLERALGVGLVELRFLHDGVAQHQPAIAGQIDIHDLDIGIDEPDVVLLRRFTPNATVAIIAKCS
jgi:hypothetical protein